MSLLPPSATPQERAAEAVMGGYEDVRDIPIAASLAAGRVPGRPAAVARLGALGGALESRLGRPSSAVRWWPMRCRCNRIEGTRAAVERMLADLGVQHDPIVENPLGRRFEAELVIANSAALPGITVADVRR